MKIRHKLLVINFQSNISTIKAFLFSIILFTCEISFGQQDTSYISWPKGKQIAVSLTFDDARMSQVDVGTALLNQYGVKATFLVVPSGVEKRIEGWKKAVADGHEMGNHTLLHPCSGNFPWSRNEALEDYTIDKMRNELLDANNQIEKLLGVKPEVFAYPCGSTFVGRGVNTKSYVPLIAELFFAGRGWLDEGPNDPSFCDFAQLTGMDTNGDGKNELYPIPQAQIDLSMEKGAATLIQNPGY